LKLVSVHVFSPRVTQKNVEKVRKIIIEKRRINPLAYTDVTETAGLARSINP